MDGKLSTLKEVDKYKRVYKSLTYEQFEVLLDNFSKARQIKDSIFEYNIQSNLPLFDSKLKEELKQQIKEWDNK